MERQLELGLDLCDYWCRQEEQEEPKEPQINNEIMLIEDEHNLKMFVVIRQNVALTN